MDPIALNLLEAWGSLIFQTLPKDSLTEYLSDDTVLLPQVGSHLNIANPLWQRISQRKEDIFRSADSSRKEKFSELIRNSDGTTREYYLGLTKTFLDLRNSPNPAMRAYFLSGYKKQSARRMASTLKKTRDDILGGAIKKVTIEENGQQYIHYGSIRVRIRKGQILLHSTEKVHVRGYLTQGLNPNVFATDATAEDPGRRLSLRLTFERHGHYSSIWLTVGGDRTAMMANTLVDMLENVPQDGIEKSPRRLLTKDKFKNRPELSYTSRSRRSRQAI
jgi:hypothetical protein